MLRTNLKLARELISHPEQFVTGLFAIDADCRDVDPTGPTACCWCALGAARKIGNTSDSVLVDHVPGAPSRAEYDATASALMDASARLYGEGWTITRVNDDKGHAAVLAMYDDAIAHAPKPRFVVCPVCTWSSATLHHEDAGHGAEGFSRSQLDGMYDADGWEEV